MTLVGTSNKPALDTGLISGALYLMGMAPLTTNSGVSSTPLADNADD